TRRIPSARHTVCLASRNQGLFLPDFSVKSPRFTEWVSRCSTSSALPNDLADHPGVVAVATEHLDGPVDLVAGHDQHHPDPEVEHPRHLVVGHLAEALDPVEDLRHVPAGGVEAVPPPVGQGPGGWAGSPPPGRGATPRPPPSASVATTAGA